MVLSCYVKFVCVDVLILIEGLLNESWFVYRVVVIWYVLVLLLIIVDFIDEFS